MLNKGNYYLKFKNLPYLRNILNNNILYMIKIKIPVHFQNKEEDDNDNSYKAVLKDITGVSSEEEKEYFIRDTYFYSIDCVVPNLDINNVPISVIHSGGIEFTSSLSLDEIDAIIQKAVKSK